MLVLLRVPLRVTAAFLIHVLKIEVLGEEVCNADDAKKELNNTVALLKLRSSCLK